MGVAAVGPSLALLQGGSQALVAVAPEAGGRSENSLQQVGADLAAAINLKPQHVVGLGLTVAVTSDGATQAFRCVQRPGSQALSRRELGGEPLGDCCKALLGIAVVVGGDQLVVTELKHQVGGCGEVLHLQPPALEHPAQDGARPPVGGQFLLFGREAEAAAIGPQAQFAVHMVAPFVG